MLLQRGTGAGDGDGSVRGTPAGAVLRASPRAGWCPHAGARTGAHSDSTAHSDIRWPMMHSQATVSIDPARYTLRLDGVTAIVPCVSVVLCLDGTDDPAGIQEFHDRGVEVLGGAVTH